MRIEAGKFYRTRGGAKAGPMVPVSSDRFPWAGSIDGSRSHFTYTSDGYYFASGEKSDADIIAEWGPTEPAEALKRMTTGYEILEAVLQEALEQASHGKGRERHANNDNFNDQPMMRITDKVGVGFPLGQALKKLEEAAGMIRRGDTDAGVRELLGAINYTAGAIIKLRDQIQA